MRIDQRGYTEQSGVRFMVAVSLPCDGRVVGRLAEAATLVSDVARQPWGQVSPSVYETARLVALAPWLDGHNARMRFLGAERREEILARMDARTSDAVEEAMATLSRSFPEGLTYRIVYNPTVFVRESINEVIHTLFEAIGLVVIVVLVFLQTWRASLIPLLAIPVSLIGTFAAMAAFGFSLNMLSLFGLVLAIGIVVDDAIVVVENVERHIADGLSPQLIRDGQQGFQSCAFRSGQLEPLFEG
jgi:hypothetical protein